MQEVINEANDRMNKAIEVLKKDYATLRAGRATPALLDKVVVEYYGVPTPINQMAKIAVPEPRMLTIQPWDKSAMADIERAIQKSDLGLTPNNDGSVIRLNIPQLTQERRSELVKVVKKKAEDCRVAVRNVRRDANDQLKMLKKEGEISEDEERRAEDEIQKTTDKHIKDIDHIMEVKEAEIMEV
jgi:ribosome recycling factor